MLVFLSGGMRSTWQDTVMNTVTGCDWFDPRTCTSDDETVYTPYDLEGLQRSDLVFAYMSQDNPSGYGLCVEIGYAAALRKPIIFVCDIDKNTPLYRYLGMTRAVSTNKDTLKEGMGLLQWYVNYRNKAAQ